MGELFGTDGVRGIANTELSAHLALKLGAASAYVLRRKHEGAKILVGRDPRISGDILESDETPVEGVLVSADNGGGSDITDVNGYYEISVPNDWSGTVTPTKTNYTFTPTSRSYTNVIADIPDQNYTGTLMTLTISGTTGVQGVVLEGLPGNPVTSAGGSYKAYEYTESVSFCGRVCHEVMDPEYTTYLNGPHARVGCVECHIGEGAEWYVRSKISGAYQVYSVLFNKYPAPIPTPIENLRPARETCERCHWPAKFHGDQMWEVSRYLNDEENTRWRIQLVMKTGGGDETTGQIRGIHWHIAQKVEYVPTDSARMDIREVRLHQADGTVEVYQSMYNPLSEEERAALPAEEIRTMDCMDCHNRPSHQYLSPRRAMDYGLETELLPRDLPYLKRVGTNLLASEYISREDGLQAIERGLVSFYEENHPDVVSTRQEDLANAVAGVQQMFEMNFFPAMKAQWSAYPTHIGHQEFPGCYRCHNGSFVSEEGKVIRNDCQLCHVILAQGPDVSIYEGVGDGITEFKHPEDIYEAWREMACHECHTGGEYY